MTNDLIKSKRNTTKTDAYFSVYTVVSIGALITSPLWDLTTDIATSNSIKMDECSAMLRTDCSVQAQLQEQENIYKILRKISQKS